MIADKSDYKLAFQSLIAENTERLKELGAINQTINIINQSRPIEETLSQICQILPNAWQYPEFTTARIIYNGNKYYSPNFEESRWAQMQCFETFDNKFGTIEVYYTKCFQDKYEGPFLKEERDLINALANIISGYINSLKGKKITKKPSIQLQEEPMIVQETKLSHKLLQKFLHKQNSDRDIYHDLMRFKVKEILLVSNLYDAFSIERERRSSDHILGEYHQLNLTSIPRITGVSNFEDAKLLLESKHFDLVIIMVGVDKWVPIDISKKIRKDFPYIPIYLLLNNNSHLKYFSHGQREKLPIDNIFVWNGDAKIFFAMVKSLEDMVNAERDTEIGLVRVILLVEDSPQYYSRYLPLLYDIVFEQTKRIIEDVNTDDLYRVLRMRARPKILLATNYEEAVMIFDKYKNNMLCLISDMKFGKNRVKNDRAGLVLVKYVKEKIKDLPTIIQSSDENNAELAHKLKSAFLNKNSESLSKDLKHFILNYLGFGNFVFKDKEGNEIAAAKTLWEFEKLLRTIPEDSLIYHGKRNHFSMWLMARGEIELAKILLPYKVSDFTNYNNLRDHLIKNISRHRNEQKRGKVIPFEPNAYGDHSNIYTLANGSLGGKGRGLAFINTLLYNMDFSTILPDMELKTPFTCAIGTDEFEDFLEKNKLHTEIHREVDNEALKKRFLSARLSTELTQQLYQLLDVLKKPIAVRSSGLFEDSLMQPFAGIFDTYILPNNHPDINIRLQQLQDAIKLVFASVFLKIARGYIEAIHYKIEDEKMGVVIQETVGNVYGDYYYPHISGVAQSYNYYPYGHMNPEDGFAVLALGLGKHVVEGEKSYRFCPQYPGVEITSKKDLFKNSQVNFYAVNMKKKQVNLLEGDKAGLIKVDIDEAELHGNIKHLASVYNSENDTISPGTRQSGPRIINFANILKYDYIPLAKTLNVVLDLVKEAMGTPCEIEFAVDLTKDKNNRTSFYLLQIKPLIGNADDYNIDLDNLNLDDALLYSEKCMGNGLISDIKDVVYIKNESFDKIKTQEISVEIEKINETFKQSDSKYLLIGPGRWGTRDKFIGIPVVWPQISNAKVIIETDLQDFPLDASSGSHFFHNVTSMNIGYCSIKYDMPKNLINWAQIEQQEVINETKYVKHIRFKSPLEIKMDGKKRVTVISTTDI